MCASSDQLANFVTFSHCGTRFSVVSYHPFQKLIDTDHIMGGAFLFQILLGLICITFAFASNVEDFKITPFGRWAKECVHVVKPGSNIINHEDHFIIHHGNSKRTVQRCKTPNPYIPSSTTNVTDPVIGEGWQAYIKQNTNSNDITSFIGSWTVPPLPTNATPIEVLYTFTGLQNIDWVPPEIPPINQSFDIIQPVLGYGARSATGKQFIFHRISWLNFSGKIISTFIHIYYEYIQEEEHFGALPVGM